jgi:hypothetical protein
MLSFTEWFTPLAPTMTNTRFTILLYYFSLTPSLVLAVVVAAREVVKLIAVAEPRVVDNCIAPSSTSTRLVSSRPTALLPDPTKARMSSRCKGVAYCSKD